MARAPQLVLTKVIARAMAVFLAWAVVRTRPIARTIKKEKNLGNSVYKHCFMTSLLVCLPSLLQSKVATLTQINSLSAIFPCVHSLSQLLRDIERVTVT